MRFPPEERARSANYLRRTGSALLETIRGSDIANVVPVNAARNVWIVLFWDRGLRYNFYKRNSGNSRNDVSR